VLGSDFARLRCSPKSRGGASSRDARSTAAGLAWQSRGADSGGGATSTPARVQQSTFRNFAQILDGGNAGTQGQVGPGSCSTASLLTRSCPRPRARCSSLYRPYNVVVTRCTFLNCGNADGTTVLF